jgi:hypothetical protein
MRRLAHLVDNPADLSRYSWAPSRTSARLALGGGLVDPAHPCGYVIVTSRALHVAFQPLADWRRTQGLSVGIFDIEDVLATYDGRRPAGGSDDATRLRNFLIDAHNTWEESAHPLRYVLLAGDSEVIPARAVFVRAGIYETSDSQPLVSDAYFAGLDGDWDADRDGLYGEGAVSGGGTGEAGEEADLHAELFVGRVPINELSSAPVDQEAQNWVAKVLRYEANPRASYLHRGLWLGERLDSSTYGDDSMDEILGIVPGLQVGKLYDSIKVWSSRDLVDRINAGVHVINHLGHANWAHVLRMGAEEVAALSNESPFLVHSQGCLAAAISTPQGEAIAERFITARGGAFAFIGNTNFGWYMPGSTEGASQVFDRGFFDVLYRQGIANLGRALQQAKEEVLGCVGAVGPERWVCLELMLLGDPYTPVVTAYPNPVARISAPSRLGRQAGAVPIIGTAHAGAASGARYADYQLYYGVGSQPRTWIDIGERVTQPVTDSLLGHWDVGMLPDGLYTLRLGATDGAGQQTIDDVSVQVDHALLASPPAESYLRVGDPVPVLGMASRGDLQWYSLGVGPGIVPSEWWTITRSTVCVLSGTLALWDTRTITRAGTYSLRLVLQGAGYYDEDRVSLNLDPQYHQNWPRTVTNRLSNESLALGDLNADGQLEVVAAEGMRNCGGALEGGRCGGHGMLLYAWNARGELLPGWPRMPGSDNRLTSPALADLDADGLLEVLVGSIDGGVYAYRHDGSAVPGWPQRTGGEVYAAPACADIDGDGRQEVVVCNALGQVHAWHGNGVPVAGWPQDAGGAAEGPLLADLDRDGKAEVTVAAASGRVSAWRGDGRACLGWPQETGVPFSAAPSAADLDGDGQIEIVALSELSAFAWRTNGELLPGWPVESAPGDAGSSPALADLDLDGDLEIIAAGRSGGVYVWHHNGQAMAGWGGSSPEAPLSSPVVGDVDGDARPDVIVVSDDAHREVYAYHDDGSLVDGWPRHIPKRDVPYPYWDRRSSGVLFDADGDGRLELGLGVERYVYLWDLEGCAEGGAPWPAFRGNMQRTGTPPVALTARGYFSVVFGGHRTE